MPYIKKSFIDRLLSHVDIVDVINSRIALKKRGNSYTCCCPFHEEKTPSFSVNQKKQYFNCFGCHKSGNAISFIMDYDNISYVEAVKEVADIASLEVEYEESNFSNGHKKQEEEGIDYYELLNQAVGLFDQEIKKKPEALSYLANRGITAETIEKYHIGFAPDAWDFILKQLGQNDSKRIKALAEIGLISEKENKGQVKYYDNFRNRVIIPIRDRRGRTIGFGGRNITAEKPKYINSKESDVFRKGSELFNLDFVRELKQSERDYIMITEGYMDVIALDQYGIHNAVASLGTATTPQQLDLLFKQSDRIIFCYDGDDAGRHAAWRALENSLATMRDDKELCFCFLPKEHDPDSFVRAYGAQGFKEYLDHADSFADYVSDMMKQKYNLTTDGGRVQLLNETGIMASRMINAPITRAGLASKMARLVNWDVERVDSVWKNIERSQIKPEGISHFAGGNSAELRTNEVPNSTNIKMTAVRLFVAHLLQYPYLKNDIPDLEIFQKLLREYGERKWAIINDLLDNIRSGAENTGVLVEKYRDGNYFEFMNYLASIDLEKQDDNVEIRVADLLTLIKTLLVEILIARNVALQAKDKLTNEELIETQVLERRIRNLNVTLEK